MIPSAFLATLTTAGAVVLSGTHCPENVHAAVISAARFASDFSRLSFSHG